MNMKFSGKFYRNISSNQNDENLGKYFIEKELNSYTHWNTEGIPMFVLISLSNRIKRGELSGLFWRKENTCSLLLNLSRLPEHNNSILVYTGRTIWLLDPIGSYMNFIEFHQIQSDPIDFAVRFIQLSR